MISTIEISSFVTTRQNITALIFKLRKKNVTLVVVLIFLSLSKFCRFRAFFANLIFIQWDIAMHSIIVDGFQGHLHTSLIGIRNIDANLKGLLIIE